MTDLLADAVLQQQAVEDQDDRQRVAQPVEPLWCRGCGHYIDTEAE